MPGGSLHAGASCGRFVRAASCGPLRAGGSLRAGRFVPLRAVRVSCRPLRAGRFVPAASCRPLRAGRFVSAASCRPLRAGRFVPAASCRLLHAGCFPPAASCRLLRPGRFVPAASCRTGSADVSRAGHRGPTAVHAGDAPRSRARCPRPRPRPVDPRRCIAGRPGLIRARATIIGLLSIRPSTSILLRGIEGIGSSSDCRSIVSGHLTEDCRSPWLEARRIVDPGGC